MPTMSRDVGQVDELGPWTQGGVYPRMERLVNWQRGPHPQGDFSVAALAAGGQAYLEFMRLKGATREFQFPILATKSSKRTRDYVGDHEGPARIVKYVKNIIDVPHWVMKNKYQPKDQAVVEFMRKAYSAGNHQALYEMIRSQSRTASELAAAKEAIEDEEPYDEPDMSR